MNDAAAILIVEDEAIVALDLRRRVERLGHRVVGVASTAAAAIRCVESLHPDLVLMDIGLKGDTDGAAAAGQIRLRWDLPVIFLTAYSDPVTVRRATSTEPFGYLIKPVEDRDLEIAITVARHRHRAEQRVKRMERWLSTVLTSIGDAVLTVDLESHLTFLNPIAERLTGWDLASAHGRHVDEILRLVREEDFAPATNPIRAVLAEGAAAWLTERTLLVRRDGERIPIDDSAAPIHDENGQLNGVVMVFRDATRQRELERGLQHAKEAADAANRAKSEFLANMSHEIRTPMNGVLGMLQLALDAAAAQEQRTYLDMARDSADSLLAIINDILDLSKIEAGALELEIAPFRLREELARVVNLLSPAAVEKGLELRLALQDGVPEHVFGDALRLRQVVLNLTANALKFTPAGSVRIEVAPAPQSGQDALRFAIVDTGIGIPASGQAGIFEPFRQAEGSTTRRFGGTGLGLSISKKLVGLMGGEIGVESAPGDGSTFWFTAPFPTAAGEAAAQVSEPAPHASAAPARPLKILLAEDNPVNQLVAQRMLAAKGHTVHTVNTGRAAVDAAIAQAFDVILMDVQMPGMDGLEATAAIRRRERDTGVHTPILALTAHAMETDRRRFLASGMDAYVSKPIRAADLFAAIASLTLRNAAD